MTNLDTPTQCPSGHQLTPDGDCMTCMDNFHPEPQSGAPCPGCGHPFTPTGECLSCEYTNLISGRTHYCGEPSCYCRGLRRFMRIEVLNTFISKEETR